MWQLARSPRACSVEAPAPCHRCKQPHFAGGSPGATQQGHPANTSACTRMNTTTAHAAANNDDETQAQAQTPGKRTSGKAQTGFGGGVEDEGHQRVEWIARTVVP